MSMPEVNCLHRHCRCGRKMVLVSRPHAKLFGEIIGGTTYWVECPKRRWWNAWKHTAPVREGPI